jgi:hypothetical protein
VFHQRTSRRKEAYFTNAKEVEAFCLEHDILPDTADDEEEVRQLPFKKARWIDQT